MSTQLSIVNNNDLSLQEMQEIDTQIDQLISRHRNNRYDINRLVFESVSALTESENYSNELHSQGKVKKFWGGLSGKNRELQRKIDSSLTRSQYASQQTLQKLAEQNLMSFELITAVNNKLNASLVSVENEINNIYGTLVTFFKQSKSDIIQLENRVERLERNVNLLNWQNSIEYQMFNGVEYADLDDTSKVVCLVRDFYDITKGQWTVSDLLLLKTAMNTIGISPKENISYFDFTKSICYNKTLAEKLFGGKLIVKQPDPEYLTLLGSINKLNLLGSDEQYIVDTVAEQLGALANKQTISENLTKSYVAHEANINIQANINSFDLIIEALYSLKQAEEELILAEDVENDISLYLERKFEQASELFRAYHPKEALPQLEYLSNMGYSKANALLYWLYCDGYYDNQQWYGGESKGFEYLEKGHKEGDCICSLLYSLFVEKDEILRNKALSQVEALATQGDIFAEYALGIAAINEVPSEDTYVKAVNHFIKANKDFYRAVYGIFMRYRNNNAPFKQDDIVHISLWIDKILEYKCPHHIFHVAYLFMEAQALMHMDDEKAYPYNKLAAELFSNLTEIGDATAPTNLGWMYEIGRGVEKNLEEAVRYYKIAAERGNATGQCNLAFCYKNGAGVEKNLEEAIFWFTKASEQGFERAKEELKALVPANKTAHERNAMGIKILTRP